MVEKIKSEKIIPVLRTNSYDEGLKMARECYNGGSRVIELTFTIDNVCAMVEVLKMEFDDIIVGIGSVLTLEQMHDAINAKADFIVSPGIVEEVLEYSTKNDILYIPGCVTISEIIRVMKHDVSIIKLFPGSSFDPSYIKAIKAPIPNCCLMVTGGVDLNNIHTWMDAGVDIVGIGSALNSVIKGDDFSEINNVIKQYKEIVA